MTADMAAIWVSMILAGLAGSLHCIGMCGPLVAGLHPGPGRGRSLGVDTAAYHLGRLWSYMLLGLLAGTLGSSLRWALAGRRWVALVFGAAILVNGVALLLSLRSTTTSVVAGRLARGLRRVLGWSGLHGRRGFAPRFLVGVLMGWLPCGLLYAMLVPAAALPSPPWSALAMGAFGLGTVPSLVAVAAVRRWATPAVRSHARALVAVLLLVAGGWMVGRSLRATPDGAACPQHPAPVVVGLEIP